MGDDKTPWIIRLLDVKTLKEGAGKALLFATIIIAFFAGVKSLFQEEKVGEVELLDKLIDKILDVEFTVYHESISNLEIFRKKLAKMNIYIKDEDLKGDYYVG